MKDTDRFERLLLTLQDTELILLKGHLLLEEQITSLIESYLMKPKGLEQARLSFAQKAHLLFCLHQISITHDDLKLILELNRIRNRLAHEADFEKNHEDLRQWACSVLDHTPKTIRRPKTYRNTLAKAFAILIGFYTGVSRSRHEILKKKSPLTSPSALPAA